jgi:hypothetical protein
MITESKLKKEVVAGCAIYRLDGVQSEVKVDCVLDGKVEFTGKNYEGKIKHSKMAIADFCKIANFYDLNKTKQEAAKMEEPNDTQNSTETRETAVESTQTNEAGVSGTGIDNVDSGAVSDEANNITENMLKIGYRFTLSDAVGEVKILKMTKSKLAYLSLAELSLDEKDRPDPIMIKKEDFCTAINTYLSGKKNTPESKEAPKVKKQKEVEAELTVKKSSDKLQVDLTPDEVLAYHEKLSGLWADMQAKENEKAGFVSQIGGEIKELKAEINTLAGKVNSKKEFREVPVTIEYHWKKNKKLTIRQDTGAIVCETAIPKSELQNTFIDD